MMRAVLLAVIALCAVGPPYADWLVADTGTWPKDWPRESEPRRKQSGSTEGGELGLVTHSSAGRHPDHRPAVRGRAWSARRGLRRPAPASPACSPVASRSCSIARTGPCGPRASDRWEEGRRAFAEEMATKQE